jgi:hypothetical protein
VSIVKGISDVAKLLEIVAFLESLGDMKALLISGWCIEKG